MSSKYEKPLIIPFKSSSDETGRGLCSPGSTDVGQCKSGGSAGDVCKSGSFAAGCSVGTSP
jgi:hypothetical protein